MSTEVDFDRRGEPPQLESVRLRDEERRLSEIHLARDVLQPGVVADGREEADARRITSEHLRGERIDLEERNGYASRISERGPRSQASPAQTGTGR
jgi:hypothetical protein